MGITTHGTLLHSDILDAKHRATDSVSGHILAGDGSLLCPAELYSCLIEQITNENCYAIYAHMGDHINIRHDSINHAQVRLAKKLRQALKARPGLAISLFGGSVYSNKLKLGTMILGCSESKITVTTIDKFLENTVSLEGCRFPTVLGEVEASVAEQDHARAINFVFRSDLMKEEQFRGIVWSGQGLYINCLHLHATETEPCPALQGFQHRLQSNGIPSINIDNSLFIELEHTDELAEQITPNLTVRTWSTGDTYNDRAIVAFNGDQSDNPIIKVDISGIPGRLAATNGNTTKAKQNRIKSSITGKFPPPKPAALPTGNPPF